MHICPLEFFWHAVSTENVERWTVFAPSSPTLYAEIMRSGWKSHQPVMRTPQVASRRQKRKGKKVLAPEW